MMTKGHTYLIFAALVSFLVIWSVVLFAVGPETIVSKIGVNNSYLLVFVLGLLGGVSSLTIAPFFAALVTAAAGGGNPLILALIGGLTITLGDTIFYFLGFKGREVIYGKLAAWMDTLRTWVEGKPIWFPQAICFVYTSVTPFPNDVLMVAMALARVAYFRIIGFVLVGNTTRMFIIASVAAAV